MLEDNNEVGVFISALRKEKGLTQRQLADQIHVTDKAISKWERGMGYPDVTNLTLLAEALGVTVGELLKGRREEAPAPQEELIKTTLVYADKASKAHWSRAAHWLMLGYSALAVIGIFVCVLCDLAVTGGVSWSIFPVSSVIFLWLVLLPSLCCRKHRMVKGLLALSVLILPYLYLLEQSVSLRGWFAPLAAPVTLISLAYLWVVCLPFRYTRINRWFLAAFAVFLIPFVDLAVDYTVSIALNEPLFPIGTVLSFFSGVVVAAVLLFFGIRSKRRKRAAAVSL